MDRLPGNALLNGSSDPVGPRGPLPKRLSASAPQIQWGLCLSLRVSQEERPRSIGALYYYVATKSYLDPTGKRWKEAQLIPVVPQASLLPRLGVGPGLQTVESSASQSQEAQSCHCVREWSGQGQNSSCTQM